MAIPKFNPRGFVLIFFLAAVSLLRILFLSAGTYSPLVNFTPLAAMALFGGAYFKDNIKAVGWPLLTLFVSDIILSQTFYKEYSNGILYSGWYWTYGAFALMALTGKYLIKEVKVGIVLKAGLVCVLIHWILTDMGVWLDGQLYDSTWSGFLACMVAAIPYEVKLMSATIIYGGIMFGSFEWMQKRYVNLQFDGQSRFRKEE